MDDPKHLFEVRPHGNVLVITFKAPEVNDTDNIESLEDGLRQLLVEHEQRFLLLDFSEVRQKSAGFQPSMLGQSLPFVFSPGIYLSVASYLPLS